MRLTNFALYAISNSIMHLGWGMIGPFYYLYVSQIGGNIEEFGIAFGIMTFVSALVGLFVGRFSDKIGRKPILIAMSLSYAAVVFSYTLITSVVQLYIVQALYGVLNAIDDTVHTSFLADITKKRRRGTQLGIYSFLIDMVSGAAIIMAGFLIGFSGFKLIFYICSVLILLGTLFMFGLKERVRRNW